jgi:peptide/nickel transport system substrate-binding protein
MWDDTTPDRTRTTRRRIIGALGASGALAAAGCVDLGGGDGSDGSSGDGSDGSGDGSGGDGGIDKDADLVGPDGEQVSLTLVYTEGSNFVATTAEFIGQELEGLGFAVELEVVTFDRLLQQYVQNQYVGDGEPEWSAGPNNAGPRENTASAEQWDLMFGIRFNTYPRTPASIDAFWTERSPTNYYGYVPQEDLASMFGEFRSTPDTERRKEIIAKAFGILSEDQPVDFLSMRDDIAGYRSKVVGPEEAFGANWDSTTWYFDEGSGRAIGGEWITGSTTDAETLYFPEISDVPSGNRVGLTLDGAYSVDENNEIQPLWMDIEDTGDGTVYVCTLRENLQWGGDFGRMTAEDWVYQTENVHTIDGGQSHPWDEDTPPSTQTADWEQIENIEATGDLEFQVELADVNPSFPLEPVFWGGYCAPKALYEKYVPSAEDLRQSEEFAQLTFTGNLGPFEFERWDRSAEFVATRNDDYYMRAHADEMGEEWAEAPYVEQYTYRVISEQATRLEALRQGEITNTGVPPDRFQDFKDLGEVDVYQIPQPFLSILAYNQRANGWQPLRTREVRQALSMSIDKRRITEEIYRGLAEFTHTFQPRWSQWYDDSQVTPFGVGDSYDKAGARQMLAEHTGSDFGYE